MSVVKYYRHYMVLIITKFSKNIQTVLILSVDRGGNFSILIAENFPAILCTVYSVFFPDMGAVNNISVSGHSV